MNKKPVLLGIAFGIALVAFPSGFLLGRRFPAHHYQALGPQSWNLIIDTSTGRVCDVRTPTARAGNAKAPDPFANFGGQPAPFSAPLAPERVPYCGNRH